MMQVVKTIHNMQEVVPDGLDTVMILDTLLYENIVLWHAGLDVLQAFHRNITKLMWSMKVMTVPTYLKTWPYYHICKYVLFMVVLLRRI